MRYTHPLDVHFAFLSLLTSAAAHGWVQHVTVNGKVYPGNGVAQNVEKPFQSVIRQKYSDSPVVSTSADAKVEGLTDLTSSDLACGPRAKRAPLSANVAAGDTITIAYKSDYTEGSTHWPYSVGPIMTYLADCGDVTCDKFNVVTAEWFKIDQQGKNKTGDWPAQAAIAAGLPVQVTMPANLKKGNYILRHEVVNLERSSVRVAEFYPNCIQTIISGSGTGGPTTGETVRFPGAYRATDKDIAYYDPYTDKTAPYAFPGPPVAAFVAGGTKSAGGDQIWIKSVPPTSAPATERNTASTSTPVKIASTSTTTHAISPAPKPKIESMADENDQVVLATTSTSTPLTTHSTSPSLKPETMGDRNGNVSVTQTSTKETTSTRMTIHTASASGHISEGDCTYEDSNFDSAIPSDTPAAGIECAIGSGAQESSAAQSRDRGLIAISTVMAFWAFYPIFASCWSVST
ncbi:glycosyl hydrolase family 61-domain-containing protein [Mycena polygramma]|nr:glycosyl hydrolase family 61-domain-containing protein [Mycena polygramma]